MHPRFFLLILFTCVTAVSYGQFWKKKKSKDKPQSENSQQPNSLDPSSTSKKYVPKTTKKSSSGATYKSEQKYYERMEALAKTKQKEEEMKAKPQYSNPMYFGHKRPPKKHKPGKMKYCKECGLKH